MLETPKIKSSSTNVWIEQAWLSIIIMDQITSPNTIHQVQQHLQHKLDVGVQIIWLEREWYPDRCFCAYTFHFAASSLGGIHNRTHCSDRRRGYLHHCNYICLIIQPQHGEKVVRHAILCIYANLSTRHRLLQSTPVRPNLQLWLSYRNKWIY